MSEHSHPAKVNAFIPGMSVTQDDIDREVASAIAGTADEKDDDESTWHEDPDPTHRGFDWHMLFIGLSLAAVLAWGAHKQQEVNHDPQGQHDTRLC